MSKLNITATTYETFKAALQHAHDRSERVRKCVNHPKDIPSDAEYFVTSDHLSGFCINEGELMALFSLVKGRGMELADIAIFYGAQYLNCFDGYLVGFYEELGFFEYMRQPNWVSGSPDVVFMKLLDCPEVEA